MEASPRTRRLLADYEGVRREFSGHRFVDFEPLGGMPPERYRFKLHVKGLRLEGDVPAPVDEHVCTVELPLGYPREAPRVFAETPVFHPNVAGHYCIADHWSPEQSLADVVHKVGAMIQYRTYNPDSPLDPVAAHYARTHSDLFPIGSVELGVPEVEIGLDAER